MQRRTISSLTRRSQPPLPPPQAEQQISWYTGLPPSPSGVQIGGRGPGPYGAAIGTAPPVSLFESPRAKRQKTASIQTVWLREREAMENWWVNDVDAMTSYHVNEPRSQQQCFDLFALVDQISAFGYTHVIDGFTVDFMYHIVGTYFGKFTYFDSQGNVIATVDDPGRIATVEYNIDPQRMTQFAMDHPAISQMFDDVPFLIAQAFLSCLMQSGFEPTPQQQQMLLEISHAKNIGTRTENIQRTVPNILVNAIDYYIATDRPEMMSPTATYQLVNVVGDGSCFFKAVGVSLFYHITSGYIAPTRAYCFDQSTTHGGRPSLSLLQRFGSVPPPAAATLPISSTTRVFGDESTLAACSLQQYESINAALVNILGLWLKFYAFIVVATKIPFQNISWYGGIQNIAGIEPITDFMAYENDVDGSLLQKIYAGHAIPSLNVVVRRLVYLLVRQARVQGLINWTTLEPYLKPLIMIPWRAPALLNPSVSSASEPPVDKVFRYYNVVEAKWINVSVGIALYSSDEYAGNWAQFYASAQNMCAWGGAGEALIVSALLSTAKTDPQNTYPFTNVLIYVPLAEALGEDGRRYFVATQKKVDSSQTATATVPSLQQQQTQGITMENVKQKLSRTATYIEMADHRIYNAKDQITVFRQGGHYQALLYKPQGIRTPSLDAKEIVNRTADWLTSIGIDSDGKYRLSTETLRFQNWAPPTVPVQPLQRPPVLLTVPDLKPINVTDAYGTSTTAEMLQILTTNNIALSGVSPNTIAGSGGPVVLGRGARPPEPPKLPGPLVLPAVPSVPPLPASISAAVPSLQQQQQQQSEENRALFRALIESEAESIIEGHVDNVIRAIQQIIAPEFLNSIATTARATLSPGITLDMNDFNQIYGDFLIENPIFLQVIRDTILLQPSRRQALLGLLTP